MGGRGASSGVSVKGKVYGSEYKALYQVGNIKFVKYNDSTSAKPPLETMTSGRVYATINEQNQVKFISYYDKHNKKLKTIDVIGVPHIIDGKKELPHTHKGYFHDEKGSYRLSKKETVMVDRCVKLWYNALKQGVV